MKYKLVYIEWEDSQVTKNTWVWDDEIEFKEMENKSIYASTGFLIKETKRAVFLSQSMCKSNFDGNYSVGYPMYIPVSAIRKRKVIKL